MSGHINITYHIHASFVLSLLIVCGRQANANAWTLLMHYVVYCNRKIKWCIGLKALHYVEDFRIRRTGDEGRKQKGRTIRSYCLIITADVVCLCVHIAPCCIDVYTEDVIRSCFSLLLLFSFFLSCVVCVCVWFGWLIQVHIDVILCSPPGTREFLVYVYLNCAVYELSVRYRT